jgi:hypothetical protein
LINVNISFMGLWVWVYRRRCLFLLASFASFPLSFPSCDVGDASVFRFGKGDIAVAGTVTLLLFDAEQFFQFLFHG